MKGARSALISFSKLRIVYLGNRNVLLKPFLGILNIHKKDLLCTTLSVLRSTSVLQNFLQLLVKKHFFMLNNGVINSKAKLIKSHFMIQ